MPGYTARPPLRPRFALILLLLAGACGRGAGTGDETAPPATDAPTTAPAVVAEETLPPLTCAMLPDALLRVAPTRAALRQAYGEPDSVAVATEPNRHMRDAVDSLFTVHYPGMGVTMRKPQGGDDMAETVEVRENRYLRYTNVGIGAPASRVHEVLGPPRESDGDRLVYSCAEGAEQFTTFWFGDRQEPEVRRITIEYYVD